MPALSFVNLLAVVAIAFAAPFLLGFVPRLRLPAVVVEILAGIAVGPALLGWVRVDVPIQILSVLGLAFLLFLAGMEIDLQRLRGRTARLAGFGAVILLSLFFSGQASSPLSKLILLAGFAIVIVLLVVGVTRVARMVRISALLLRLQDTTAEIRVRAAIVLLIAFVALAERLGLETILAAFLAGATVRLIDQDQFRTHPNFPVKLEAIGYGFLIPVFFVSSGLQFDLRALFSSPSTLLRLPLFLAALLVVRGLPALLYRAVIQSDQLLAAALLQATSLPFIVAATAIGL